jgi:hypothetical protein
MDGTVRVLAKGEFPSLFTRRVELAVRGSRAGPRTPIDPRHARRWRRGDPWGESRRDAAEKYEPRKNAPLVRPDGLASAPRARELRGCERRGADAQRGDADAEARGGGEQRGRRCLGRAAASAVGRHNVCRGKCDNRGHLFSSCEATARPPVSSPSCQPVVFGFGFCK